MNYPAGTKVPSFNEISKAKKKKRNTMKVSSGNRGMSFESAINETNAYYDEKGLALITKRPTPINIVKVDYSKGAKITNAYFETQSTTDYNGIIKERYVDFEAKSTRNKTSFPLANIPAQQITHLKKVIANKGIAFFLINFSLLHETYLLSAQYVIDFVAKKERSSIPLKDIKDNGYLIKEGFRPSVDYLPAVLEAFFK